MGFVIAAITFGLVAGLNPGPLGVFVIHQTMSRGIRSGLIASCTPFVTDLPIIILVALLTIKLGDLDWFVSVISVAGSLYLAFIAYRILNSPSRIDPGAVANSKVDWLTGVKMNFLNPVPYIFWGTVGSIYINKGTTFEACVFVITMLLTLCSSKFLVAIAVRYLGERFNPRVYAAVLRSLSLPMLLFSGKLLYSGMAFLWS
jgi:threonine/homoserine/homoserine lactone efflux protein